MVLRFFKVTKQHFTSLKWYIYNLILRLESNQCAWCRCKTCIIVMDDITVSDPTPITATCCNTQFVLSKHGVMSDKSCWDL